VTVVRLAAARRGLRRRRAMFLERWKSPAPTNTGTGTPAVAVVNHVDRPVVHSCHAFAAVVTGHTGVMRDAVMSARVMHGVAHGDAPAVMPAVATNSAAGAPAGWV
jgi:hypothetical protein